MWCTLCGMSWKDRDEFQAQPTMRDCGEGLPGGDGPWKQFSGCIVDYYHCGRVVRQRDAYYHNPKKYQETEARVMKELKQILQMPMVKEWLHS